MSSIFGLGKGRLAKSLVRAMLFWIRCASTSEFSLFLVPGRPFVFQKQGRRPYDPYGLKKKHMYMET